MRWPYQRLLTNASLRWLAVGGLMSAVGDGMAVVGVPWLALHLAQPAGVGEGVAVAAAATAATLTGVPLALAAGVGWFRFDPRRMLLADSVLRGVVFLVVGGLASAHQLSLWGYVALLGCSSVLHTVASGARRLIMTDLADIEQRLEVNSLITTQLSIGTWALGPALGGVLVASLGASVVLAVNGLTFLPLLLAAVRLPSDAGHFGVAAAAVVRTNGVTVLRRQPALLALLLLALGVDALYYPVEVALPVHVAHVLGDAAVLGAVWAGFGAGAIVGSVLSSALGRLPPTAVLVGATIGWAASLAGFAVSREPWLTVLVFAVGGLLWAPFNPMVYNLMQGALATEDQQPMVALWTALLQGVAPLALVLSGPLITAIGATTTLWGSAVATAGLGLLVATGVRALPTHANRSR